MIIGFTTRTVCVPENNTEPGFDVWFLPIEVATLRTAEREHPMIFRVQEASSSAIVEPIGGVVNQLYDATFGTRNNFGDPIEVFFVLEALEDTISPQTAFIRDDRRLEDAKECFTIRIFPMVAHNSQSMFLAVVSCLLAMKMMLVQTTTSVNTLSVSKMTMVGLLHSLTLT